MKALDFELPWRVKEGKLNFPVAAFITSSPSTHLHRTLARLSHWVRVAPSLYPLLCLAGPVCSPLVVVDRVPILALRPAPLHPGLAS
jgi:hypothetical protein